MSMEILEWQKRQRATDLMLIANAAVSDGKEASQTEREHAAMARRLLAIEADREQKGVTLDD